MRRLDDRHIAIPDLNGNNRLDSYRNLIEHPYAGVLMIVPGKGETPRTNGPAVLTTDPDLTLFTHALPITFSGYDRAETLTNFPALIQFNSDFKTQSQRRAGMPILRQLRPNHHHQRPNQNHHRIRPRTANQTCRLSESHCWLVEEKPR